MATAINQDAAELLSRKTLIAAFRAFAQVVAEGQKQIDPYAWVINQWLVPLTVRDPVLQSRQAAEWKLIHEVEDVQATRTVILAWQAEPPVGIASLELPG